MPLLSVSEIFSERLRGGGGGGVQEKEATLHTCAAL